MSGILRNIFKAFKPNKYYQTFTYYIPAPPSRHSSYREKEFDQLVLEINRRGFEIEQIKTVSHQTSNQSGCWIICLLSSNDKTLKLELNFADKVVNPEQILDFE